jgi:two-component system NtrC family sensor kinase
LVQYRDPAARDLIHFFNFYMISRPEPEASNVRLPAANASAIGLLRVLLVASLLVPMTLFGVVSWLTYRAEIEEAEHDLSRTSEVAREHAEKIFDSQDQLAERINDLLRDTDANAVESNEKRWHDTLNGLTARLPHVASVLIASTSGTSLASAEVFPVPHDVDLHGRDYFDAIVGGDKGPFVSSLQTGSVYRKPFFGLARPWTAPDGSLNGVIDIVVSPTFFADFYQVLIGEGVGGVNGKILTLVRDNGRILVRYPRFTNPQSNAPTPVAFLDAIHTSPDGGMYTSRSVIDPDAPLRLFAFRQVRGYPLYVAAGRSWDAILEEWRSDTASRLLFGVPFTLVLFAVTWTALARTRREEQALLRANQEIQRREVAEEALLRAQRLEAVGQLTGGVAHDFNNLLTVIAGNAALIDKRADNAATARRLAGSIQLAAMRGAEITQQLLAFAGRQSIRPETIDLNRRLLEFKPLLDRAAQEAIQIRLDLDASLRPARIDPGQFESAILNLVGNARDAMPNGGSITITTRSVAVRAAGAEAPEPMLRIAVADTGTGMDRDTAAKAFEPFFTTKEVGKGTGLGLSQVYGFARQAGGTVRISSILGKGTTIEITLPPSAEILPAETGSEAIARPLKDTRGAVVLVVEDEPNVLEMAVETVEQLGYVAMAAPGPLAALERLKQAVRVDVLFTDVVMPGGMNGLQLSTEARRLRPDIKVLLTSGYVGLAGMDMPEGIPLLPKPYNRDQLSLRLEAVLEASDGT